MQIAPSARFFVFLDGGYLGERLIEHFGLAEERGFTNLGRVRVERLEEDQT